MGIFIFMYIAFVLIYLISTQFKNSSKKFICISSFLLLFAIQALRSIEIGIDVSGSYVPSFLRLNVNLSNCLIEFNNNGYEYGYQIYTNIISLITTNPHVFLAITSFIILAPITYIIYKYSENTLLSFVIFASFIIYHFSFSGLRQAISISLTVISYHLIRNNKPLLFVAMILLATSFHTSAIIFLIAYPIYKLKISPTKTMILLILGLSLILFLEPITLLLSNFIFQDKYIGYIDSHTVPAYNLMILLMVILLLTLKTNSSSIWHLRILILLSIFLQSLGIISTSATRIAYFFYIYIIIAIPDVIQNSNINIQTKYILNTIIFLLMSFFFFYTNASGYLDVIPYKFLWE